MNLCVSYLWFTFYYTTFEITPRHLLWQFDTHLLYIFILVIIFVRGCFYTIHDALEIGEILNICLKKCQKLHFPTNFRKLWWSWERIHFIQFTKEEWKKKWCIKHDIVLCTTIREYSNVYFLVIFFIYQVVALFSLANDSYILLFKNDSYKSTKHFIGKTFFYFSTINHFNSRYFSLLDNASNQVVGCTIQKIYNNKCPSFEWLFAIVMNNE